MATQYAKRLARERRAISDQQVREIHRRIFEGAWTAQAGEYRHTEVDAFPPYGDLPPHDSQLRGEMLVFGRELADRTVETNIAPGEEVELAIWGHMELVRIHPFEEGNGKTARLLLAAIMMRNVTGPTRPLRIPEDYKDRYITAVKAHRRGSTGSFEDLIVDLLERESDE